MSNRTPAYCKTCRAEIYWITLETTGKLIPLDATPHPRGTVALRYEEDYTGGSGRHTARPVSSRSPALPGETLYLSHFATCPQSKEHRKPDEPPAEQPPATVPGDRPRRFRARIEDAKRIGEEAGAKAALVLIFSEDGRFEGATWGEGGADRRSAQTLLDAICDRLQAGSLLRGGR